MGESTKKAVIVRVKRKLEQSPVEALWIEINERPVKRPFLDFQNLSIASSSSSSTKREDEAKVKRVLLQHVETLATSQATLAFLNSFVEGSSAPQDDSHPPATGATNPRRRTLLTHNIHQRNLSKAKQQQQDLAKSARFEQIWKRRSHNNGSIHDDALGEVCRVYDVLRVDVEDTSATPPKQEEMSEEDQEALRKFLPLLRDCIPLAAEQIESDFSSQPSKQDSTNGYVYDLYAVKEEVDEVEASYPFPLVQLDDDDQCYDGSDGSDYETDDSNAENHPYNDYPEEESSEEEEGSKTSGSESEEDESKTESDESDESLCFNKSEADLLSDDELGENSDDNSNDANSGDEDWRWAYR